MGNKIKIAELDIDDAALVKSTSDIKKQIDVLVNAQKELKKEGDTSSKTFIKNAADLRILRKAYNDNIKAVSERTQAVADAETREKLLEVALNQTATSIDDARAQTKLLTKLRNATNVATAEGRAELEKLNEKLDENTEFIKENADALLRQKLNIGNYAESIKDALQELNPFNGGLLAFISRAQTAGGVTKLLSSSIKTASKAFIGLTKASLAFLATPIGVVIALIAGAFLLVKNAMNRSEESTNKLKVAFSAFTGIISKVLKLLEPLGEFLIDGIVVGIELAEKAVFKLIDSFSGLLNFLGFEKLANSVKSFGVSMQIAAEQARDLARAEADLEKAQRQAQLVQLKFQKDAEKLRQLRDDETKSFKERIAANDQLGVVLQKQLETELAIARQALLVASLRIELEGETTETLNAQAEALINIADIEERITGVLSEQLSNRNSLRKDAIAAAREAAQKAIDISKQELDLFIEQNKQRSFMLEQEIALANEIRQRKLKIVEEEVEQGLKTRLEGQLAETIINNEFLDKQTDLVLENAERELDIIRQTHQTRIQEGQLLTEAIVQQERERLQLLLDEQLAFQQLRLEQGVIGQLEFNLAINQINQENREALAELEAERKEQEAEARAIDIDNQRILNQERFDFDLGLQLEQLERQKQAELENAEKTGADKTLIEKKFAEQEKDIRKQVRDNKIQLAADALGNLVTILGKESAAGKAVAVAQTTITTFQSATSAFNSLSGIPIVGPVLGAVAAAAAIAAGLANVRKIVSTKPPSIPTAEKGALFEIGGNRHYSGGTKFMGEDGTAFEAEKGELIGVMNRRAAMMFKGFNDQYATNSTSRPNFLQDGGFVQRSITSNSTPVPTFNTNNVLDTDVLAGKIAEANRELPPPVTDVKDVIDQVNNFNSVVDGANI